MASIYIENYGCTANYDDGAIIAGILTESGHIIVKDIEESDIDIAIENDESKKYETLGLRELNEFEK